MILVLMAFVNANSPSQPVEDNLGLITKGKPKDENLDLLMEAR